VSARLLETFFRHWLLILAPLVLLPLVVTILTLQAPAQFESTAGVWVERSTYVDVISDVSPYITPAQSQANRLAELLRSPAFVTDVATRSGLLGARSNDSLRRVFQDGIDIVPSGDHYIILRFRAFAPDDAARLLSATISAFNARTKADQGIQSRVAIALYQNRLAEAQDHLAKANTALSAYLAGNPALRGSTGYVTPVGALDSKFGELQHATQTAQADADRARTMLDRAQLDSAAAQVGQELGFQVTDPPQLPTGPSIQLRKVLIYPAAAFIGGLFGSLMLLLLLALGDQAVRRETDLPSRVPVTVVLPRFGPARSWRRTSSGAVRRAIGPTAITGGGRPAGGSPA
jgi:uncharacterized protein involved in exopolysaccharide biosynthesis